MAALNPEFRHGPDVISQYRESVFKQLKNDMWVTFFHQGRVVEGYAVERHGRFYVDDMEVTEENIYRVEPENIAFPVA